MNQITICNKFGRLTKSLIDMLIYVNSITECTNTFFKDVNGPRFVTLCFTMTKLYITFTWCVIYMITAFLFK